MHLLPRYPLARIAVLMLLMALPLVGCNGYKGTPKKENLTKRCLNELGFALTQYSDDWDDLCPPASDTATLKRCLDTYIARPYNPAKISPQAEALFIAPISEKEFVLNPSLIGKKRAVRVLPDGSRELVENKILFYEPTAEWKGKERYVVMQNGTVERVSENIWPMTKKENGIP